MAKTKAFPGPAPAPDGQYNGCLARKRLSVNNRR